MSYCPIGWKARKKLDILSISNGNYTIIPTGDYHSGDDDYNASDIQSWKEVVCQIISGTSHGQTDDGHRKYKFYATGQVEVEVKVKVGMRITYSLYDLLSTHSAMRVRQIIRGALHGQTTG
jgi:hypothetical protein